MNWRCVRLKQQYRVVDQRAGSEQPPLLAVSIHHGVVPRHSLTDKLPRAEDLSNYKVCSPGDIVLNRMRAFQGAIGIASVHGMVSPDYLVIRPNPDTDARYFHHLFRSSWFVGEMVSRLRGIGGTESGSVRTPRINAEDLGDITVSLPLLEDQRRIADFLDFETGQIDALVDLRARQLELLAEAGVSRVFAAVRGENIPGPRKDSGLPWLGDIPKGWQVAAVAHHFDVDLGKMLNPARAQGEYMRPYLRVANVQWGKISTEDLLQMDFPPDERRRYELRAGDLLVCEGGSWPGRAAIWDGSVEEIYYQKALHRLRPTGSSLTGWLYYCLMAAERLNVFAVQGNTSTMTHLTREQLRPQRFPFPGIERQRSAVVELDIAAKADDELRQVLAKQLSLLGERRQALITAAVTGQLDVTTARPTNDRDL